MGKNKDNSARFVVIREPGGDNSHIIADLDGHLTLCGMDGDDPNNLVQQQIISNDNKVTCRQCHKIWLVCKGVRAGSFRV